MANLTTDLDGSATIELSDGSKLRIPGFVNPSQVAVQDVRNVVAALWEVIDNLDKRLAALERRNNPRTFPCV